MDGNINTLFTNLATTIRNVSVAVGVFAFMWGAIQYATSGGSPHQLEQGKSAMKASLPEDIELWHARTRFPII